MTKIIRYKGWEEYKGWQWYLGGEGEVIAETEEEYKLKIGLFRTMWVLKIHCAEITTK